MREPREFVFPPESQIWRISRENVLLLGGPAAAILQVAHPEIAAGVAGHSNFREDALGRLRRTLDAVYIVTFGTRTEAAALRDHVAAIHSRVRGDHPVKYDAFSPDAQMWVLATLIATGTWIFEQVVAPLSDGERESHYREMRLFGTYFGLSEAHGPQTAREFQTYYNDMLNGPVLASHPICREVASAVAWPSRPLWLAATSSIASVALPETIPGPVREKLGFSSTEISRYAFLACRSLLRQIIPHLPARIRYTPRYLAARSG